MHLRWTSIIWNRKIYFLQLRYVVQLYIDVWVFARLIKCSKQFSVQLFYVSSHFGGGKLQFVAIINYARHTSVNYTATKSNFSVRFSFEFTVDWSFDVWKMSTQFHIRLYYVDRVRVQFFCCSFRGRFVQTQKQMETSKNANKTISTVKLKMKNVCRSSFSCLLVATDVVPHKMKSRLVFYFINFI